MSERRHRAELGRRIDVHRPLPLGLGVAVILAISLPFALLAAFGPPGPLVGLMIFLLFAVPFTYGLGEWLFLQHRLYEHGIVFRSVPGLRTFVVPHYTIDPKAFEIATRRIHDGGVKASLETSRSGEYRVTPFTARTIRFVGLYPKYARELARGKLDWQTAGDDYELRDGRQVWVPQAATRWAASCRNAERYRELLADSVRQSQRVQPFNRASG